MQATQGLCNACQFIADLLVSSLQSCLRMFETRETRNGALWYHKLGTEAVRGLASRQTPVWQLHGYVIALSELLCSSGEFMVAR